MNCISCGAPMRSSTKNVPYDENALPGVMLYGVKVSRCPKCGEEEVAIPNLAGLHLALAKAIVSKPGRLCGPEIRFLRKFLGYSGSDFARVIGSNASTISRWESGAQSMNVHADRLLRLMVMYDGRKQEYPLSNLAEIQRDAETTHYEARTTGADWDAIAA